MKNLITYSIIALLFVGCQNATNKINNTNNSDTPTNTENTNTTTTQTEINAQIIDDSGSAQFTWTNDGGQVWDFGTIQQGDEPEYTFSFTNSGQEPMIISNAKGSCGCTVPEWPKEPIAPGETGTISVKFNSKNKKGLQNKTVTITANTTPATTKLRVTGTIEVPE